MRNQDRLFKQVTWAVLPLLIWAAHFFYCYVYLSLAHGGSAALLVASLAALALATLLLARAARLARAVNKAPHATVPLLDWTSFAIAALALIGIIWSCIPMLMLAA